MGFEKPQVRTAGRGKPLPYITTKGRVCGGGRSGAGGVEPLPYVQFGGFYVFAGAHFNSCGRTAGGQNRPPLQGAVRLREV